MKATGFAVEALDFEHAIPPKQNPAFRKMLVTSWTGRRIITRTDGQTSRFVRCQTMPHFINTLLHAIINTLLHSIINALLHSITNHFTFNFYSVCSSRNETRLPGKNWSLPGQPDGRLYGQMVKQEDLCGVKQCPTS